MSGWQWFWTLVGFILFTIVLIFLYFSTPFETVFSIVLNGLSFNNVILWATLVTGIVGFCTYHWRAYRVHIVGQHSVESMVLASLRGSTFIAILLSGGATLQAVQNFCIYLLEQGTLDGAFARRLGAILALVILTGVFCLIFWLLRVVQRSRSQSSGPVGA